MRYTLIKNGTYYGMGSLSYMYELLSNHICTSRMYGRKRVVYEVVPSYEALPFSNELNALQDDTQVAYRPDVFCITHHTKDHETTHDQLDVKNVEQLLREWCQDDKTVPHFTLVVTIQTPKPLHT